MVVGLTGALMLAGCFSSDNEVHYDGPREAFVDACARALAASPGLYGDRQIVEHVTVSDPDARYPIATGELFVQRNSGEDGRYRWTCEIPEGDDYLAARITEWTPTE